ncbi:MAG: hypothetical protein LBB57_05340, partial [Clostridiales Family XIII bacterium]|nr:hypothetical protein [Clostridiales Family XIII bacterium]
MTSKGKVSAAERIKNLFMGMGVTPTDRLDDFIKEIATEALAERISAEDASAETLLAEVAAAEAAAAESAAAEE